jgi:hypothetical protein
MSNTSAHPVWVPSCVLCNRSVELETCKVDERGSAVHEECYVRKIRRAYGWRFSFAQVAVTRLSSRSRRPLTHFATSLRAGCRRYFA